MADHRPRRPPALTSLSARLLVLTIFFIMVAEIMIWAPSISRFRKVYLEDRIVRAHLATLALETMPEAATDKDLGDDLLYHAEAYGIVLNRPDQRVLMVSKDMPPAVDATVDIEHGTFFGWIRDALETLAQDRNRVLRVIGVPPKNADVKVEILIDEAPMREAMFGYSARILNLSIVISLFTAGLVYISLQWLMVRPMRRITAKVAAFREAPEDATRDIRPSDRADEIGVTERELAVMQGEIRHALQQKSRLATLGAAVAKINHDLRNSLATAVLAFDKLADVDDPEVKRVLPRLYGAMDRATKLCTQTLDYVGDTTPSLSRSRFHLQELVAEAQAALRASDEAEPAMTWSNEVDFDIEVEGDRNQLFRVFTNLGHNAREAGASTLTVSAQRQGNRLLIDVADNGPGLSERARNRLFQPFAASSKDGGTGLGLVIALDIMKAHGGDIRLLETETGAAFRLELPARTG